MSVIAKIKCKCSVCRKTNEYQTIMRRDISDGSPDLDLRTPEMKKSTMTLWLQECPKCGYVSKEVEDRSNVTKKWLKSEEYLSCDGISFVSGLAARFYKYYLICLKNGKPEDAFFAILHASWACDDAGDRENAVKCREKAADLADPVISEGTFHEESLMVMKADILRRSRQFDRLIDEYSSIRFQDDLLNRILKFQIEKAKEEDDDCYRVENVLLDVPASQA